MQWSHNLRVRLSHSKARSRHGALGSLNLPSSSSSSLHSAHALSAVTSSNSSCSLLAQNSDDGAVSPLKMYSDDDEDEAPLTVAHDRAREVWRWRVVSFFFFFLFSFFSPHFVLFNLPVFILVSISVSLILIEIPAAPMQ
jgi:hypothetical protein